MARLTRETLEPFQGCVKAGFINGVSPDRRAALLTLG